MVRGIIFLVAALAALAGCASAPYVRVPGAPPLYAATPPPPGPNIYTTAPRAPFHAELFACGNYGANLGEIGARRESILYTPYIETQAGAMLRNPTESACLASGFGWRGAADGGGRQHTGLDLANSNGGFIYAAADGTVLSNGWRNGYGLTLELDHGSGVHTLYAHLNEIDSNLAPGSFVSAGAPVARMGMTGNATGIHLHYEVSVDGLQVDPIAYGRPAFDTAPIY